MRIQFYTHVITAAVCMTVLGGLLLAAKQLRSELERFAFKAVRLTDGKLKIIHTTPDRVEESYTSVTFYRRRRLKLPRAIPAPAVSESDASRRTVSL